MRPKNLKLFLKEAARNKKPVLVVSSPGFGKTEICGQVAKELDYDFFVSHPTTKQPVDYSGLPAVIESPDGKEAVFLPYSDLKVIKNAKRPLYWLIDDLGQVSPSVQAPLMQAVGAGQINEHKISSYVVPVAASNRREDMAAVKGIIEPFKSRFCSIIELTPDVRDWTEDFAIPHGLLESIIAFVNFRPEFMTEFKPTKDMTQTASPRTIVHANEIMTWDLPEALKREGIAGAAGERFAHEYFAFREHYELVPDPDVALENPMDVHLPLDNISAMYATAMAVAMRVTKEKMANFSRLIERFTDQECRILAMVCAVRRDNDLKKTRAYAIWVQNNKDVLIG